MKAILAAAAAAAAMQAWASESPAAPETSPMALAIARIKALPERELKAFYRRCARASVRGQLGSSEIALCSVGYQHLLDHYFGGDFDAFLDWRRRPEAPAQPPTLDPS